MLLLHPLSFRASISPFDPSYFISASDILSPIISHAITFVKHVDLILRHELFSCLTSLLNNRLPGVTDSVLPLLICTVYVFF